MRFALLAAPLFSILVFSWTAKAQPLALTKLLTDSDKVAVCKTDSENLSLINFYVHKVNPLIVAHLKTNHQEHFYSVNIEEQKDLVTLSTDKEIIALDYDLYFKNTKNKFTAHFSKETIHNPEIKHFLTTLHFENGQAIDLTCQRTN